jgi:hypothetical protein
MPLTLLMRLFKNPKAIGIGILVLLALVGYWKYSSMNTEILELTIENIRLDDELQKSLVAIDRQNTKVAELQAEGQNLLDTISENEERLAEVRTKHQQELVELQTEVIVDDSCKGVMEWMLEKSQQ